MTMSEEKYWYWVFENMLRNKVQVKVGPWFYVGVN